MSLTLIALGGFAVRRLDLSYVPETSFPEIDLRLELPQVDDLESLTRRWVVPIEGAIRAAGGVHSITGEVTSRGASLRVRLAPGEDSRRKSARIESELARIRSVLPSRGQLMVSPRGEGRDRSLFVIWLTGGWEPSVLRSLRDDLERLEPVRRVEIAGETTTTLEVEPYSHRVSVAQVEEQIGRGFRAGQLGRADLGNRRAEVLVRTPLSEKTLASLPLAVGQELPLRAVAGLTWVEDRPLWRTRLDGREGKALLISRELDSSPMALSAAVRKHLRGEGLSERTLILLDEAEPLARLLRRVATGLLAGTLMAALAGWLLGAGLAGWRPRLAAALYWSLVPLVGAGAVLHAFLILELPLDATTVPPLLIGLCSTPLIYGVRCSRRATAPLVATSLLAGSLPLVAVHLAGGDLTPLLDGPSRALAVATVAATLGALLPPLPAYRGRSPVWRWSHRSRIALPLVGGALRHGATVLLAGAAATYSLLTLGGSTLAPRVSTLSPPLGDLLLQATFAEGTTLEQAGQRLAAVEDHLVETHLAASGTDSYRFERVWSTWTRRFGSIVASVDAGSRDRATLRRIAARLRHQLAGLPLALDVRPLVGSGQGRPPVELRARAESRPEADDGATRYRVILRSTRLESLERAEASVRERVSRFDLGYRNMTRAWGPSEARLELRPVPLASETQIERASAALRERIRYPRAEPWPGEKELRLQVRSRVSPLRPEDARPRELLTQILSGAGGVGRAVPASLFEIREVAVPPRVLRENGRFALPLDLTLPWGPVRNVRERERIHHALGRLPLPAGVELERPEIARFRWDAERWRVLAVSLTLPALLLALAACRLDSLIGGAVTLICCLPAVGAVTPFLWWGTGDADVLTLGAIGAALCVFLPVGWQLAAGAREGLGGGSGCGRLYRSLAPLAGSLVAAGSVAVAVLVFADGALPADRWVWVMPLRVAAVVGGASLLAQLTLMPALLVGFDRWRERRGPEARRRADPAVWHQLGELTLTTRNLTKIFPRTLGGRARTERDPRDRREGFHALSALDLELETGIVGLLGPNGAGKTTLLRLLCGLLEPTRGQVLFRGVPVEPLNLARYRRGVGFLPQGFNAYPGFTGRAFLDYWAIERGMRDRGDRDREIDRVLEAVDLVDAADRRVRDFSGGMRRRIGIARALLGDPPILIVDEPTTGLDVESRNRLRTSLRDIAGRRIIVFSTHIASDVGAVARRILVLHQGRLLFDGPPSALVQRARGRVFDVLASDEDLRSLSQGHRITARVRRARGLEVRFVLGPGQSPPSGAGEASATLEEAYLALMYEAGSACTFCRERPGSLLNL